MRECYYFSGCRATEIVTCSTLLIFGRRHFTLVQENFLHWVQYFIVLVIGKPVDRVVAIPVSEDFTFLQIIRLLVVNYGYVVLAQEFVKFDFVFLGLAVNRIRELSRFEISCVKVNTAGLSLGA